MELIGLYLVGCFLLIVAGVAKAVRPDATALALTALPANRLPVRWVRRLVRVGSFAEAVLGVVALAVPAPVAAWLVAAGYGAFAVMIVYVRSKGGALASCGCFGTPDTPATALHLAVDVGLAIAAVAVALDVPAGSMLGVLARQPAHGAPLVLVSGLCAWLAYLAVSTLAALQAARAIASISFRRH